MSGRSGAAVAALAALAAAAGCGGGSSWDQRADAICDRAETAIRSIEAPEDVGDLDRVLVRVSEEVRAATGEIRKLETSEEEKRHAKAVLADLGLVETSLGRISDATATGARRPIEKAARALRLDAVDVAAHAEQAGLTRCGREEVGVAAVDAVLAPPFAAWITENHATFLDAERTVARRYPPNGRVPERARYWLALFTVTKKTQNAFDTATEAPESATEAVQDYFGALEDLADAADYFNSYVQGEKPLSRESYTEPQGRRKVAAYRAAVVPLLEALGPAGAAQLRLLAGGPGGAPAVPEGQDS